MKQVSKNVERSPNRTAPEWDWKEVRSLILRKKLNCQSLRKELFSSAGSRLPVRSSSPHSKCHAATYRYLAVPRVLVSS